MLTLTNNDTSVPEEFKKCSACRENKSISEFHKNQHYCKVCSKENYKEFRKSLPKEKIQWYRRTEDLLGQYKRRSERTFQLKLEMILAYGGMCSCCGETEIKFLTLEHLEGGGNQHRKEFSKASRTWADLKKRGWPKGHTILCWNCQMGKTHYGICPHQQIIKKLMEVA